MISLQMELLCSSSIASIDGGDFKIRTSANVVEQVVNIRGNMHSNL
jgi:hypothetical protein